MKPATIYQSVRVSGARFVGVAALFAAIGLAGCSDGATDQPVTPSAASVSLTDLSAQATKENHDDFSRNLIDLSGDWPTWDGGASGITYDAGSNTLTIPASSGGVAVVHGVQRFDEPLVFGRRYSLTFESNNAQAAALLFLFNEAGQILTLPGRAETAYLARSGQPFIFDAPAGVAGFYLQVQNAWRATTPATAGSTLTATGPNLYGSLIDPRGPWVDWAGAPVDKVSYDALDGRIMINPPAAGSGNTIAIERLAVPLQAGAEYDLAMQYASTPGMSVLLFMFDAAGWVIPVQNPSTGVTQSWLAATADAAQPVIDTGDTGYYDSVRFVAPPGVASIAVQVQSAWNATAAGSMKASLRAAAAY